MSKSKWQEEGKCPVCGKGDRFVICYPPRSISIKTGELQPFGIDVQCVFCRAIFNWFWWSGRITRASAKSPADDGARRK